MTRARGCPVAGCQTVSVRVSAAAASVGFCNNNNSNNNSNINNNNNNYNNNNNNNNNRNNRRRTIKKYMFTAICLSSFYEYISAEDSRNI